MGRPKTREELFVEDTERRLTGVSGLEKTALNHAFFAHSMGSLEFFLWYHQQPVEGLALIDWVRRYGDRRGPVWVTGNRLAASYRYYLREAKKKRNKKELEARGRS